MSFGHQEDSLECLKAYGWWLISWQKSLTLIGKLLVSFMSQMSSFGFVGDILQWCDKLLKKYFLDYKLSWLQNASPRS